MKEIEVSNKVVSMWMTALVVVGGGGLIVARETGQMDLFEYGLLGIVAVVCLGYSCWAVVSWGLKRVSH
jgi:hypothetical protein